jgi:uncharacterized protein (DUF1800 family)
MLWLNRVTFGASTATLEQYQKLGRAHFLAAQLAPSKKVLPVDIQGQIDALEVSRLDASQVLEQLAAERQRINTLTDDAEKEAARKALNDHGNKLAYEAARRELLRALYSSAQLQEQLEWFWLNHFSIYQAKADERWLAASYADAIRSHSLGHFKDLVMATLTHPAMLQYLDNVQNSAGHINENYARELMELHTLGVNAGYTQQDVQELARILTGVGVNASGKQPNLKREWQSLYLRKGAFEFNPARHDFGSKTVLNKHIEGQGFGEVEQALELLVRQRACAQFISRKLAVYFVSDMPSPKLVEQMAKTFQKTDGDIAAVLRTMFSSQEFTASLGQKFKDPMHFVISSLRLAYVKPIANTHPIVNWLNSLGQPLFGRLTPDGYPLAESGWASSGQMSRRFEIARAIASGNAGLFEPEDGTPATITGFPRLATRLYFDSIEAHLSMQTRETLERANSQLEWNTFLLASPEFNYR